MFGRFSNFATRRQSKSPSVRRPKSPRQRLMLQALEDRAVPATFTVLNTTDGPVTGAGQLPGSLRQAIFDANASAGADSIDMTGVSGSITLTNGQLLISDSVVVNGPGSLNLTVDGNLLSRVFDVNDSKAGSITVTLSNFAIANGKVTGAGNDGGGVRVADEDFTLNAMKLSGNAAARGGAVSLNSTGGGKLSILNSSITGNNTTGGTDGGGVFFLNFKGSLTVDNSDISGNIAQSGGGGIYIGGVTDWSISNSSITGNTANSTLTTGAGGGGGIIVLGTINSGTATLKNTTLAFNQTAAITGSGGGMVCGALVGDIRFQNCTVTGNFAAITGGGFSRFAGRGDTYFESTIISGNSATNGADIWNSFPTKLAYSAVGSVAGFTPTDLGNNLPYGATLNLAGAATNNGGNTLTVPPQAGSPVVDSGFNFAGSSNDQRGAGFARSVGATLDIGAFEVQVADASPSVVATINQPTVGAGTYTVAVVYRDDLGINLGSIDANDLSISGFGYIGSVPASGVVTAGSGGSVTATYTFPAPNNNGFGTWDPLDNPSTFTIAHDGSVSDTSSNFILAGAVGVLNTRFTQTFVASDSSTFINAVNNANNSPNSADTIDLSGIGSPTTITLGGELLISDSLTIKGPANPSFLVIQGSGTGRLFNVSGPGAVHLNITNSTLTGGNHSGTGNTIRGGAIFSEDDPITISKSVLTGNTVTAATTLGGDGGAIAMYRGNVLTITDCTFSSNTAFGGASDGGAIFIGRSGQATIDRSIISGNAAQSSGGGIYGTNALLTVTNSLITGNVHLATGLATGGGGGIYLLGSANRVTIVNSTISGNTSGLAGGAVLLRSSGVYTSFFNVYNSTVTGNRAGTGGGGFANTLSGSPFTFESSIVQGNYHATTPDFFTLGAVVASYSALGVTTGAATYTDNGNNLVGQNIKLGALASNGGTGSFYNHLPGPGSPLIGAGTNASSGVTTDQRGVGFSRTLGGSVDIGAVESAGTDPVALAPSLPDVGTKGGTSYSFTVTYIGSVNMDATSFDNNDVRVTSTTGFNVLATKGAVTGGGTTYDVTYSFTPPGGSWDGVDSGTYTVSMESAQVKDAGSVFVAPGPLGQFKFSLPFEVTNATDTSVAGKVTLREAIAAANSNPDANTITFDPTVFGSATTITLGSSLTISSNLTIQGPGAKLLTLKSGTNARHFNITDGVAGAHKEVTLSGLRMADTLFTTALIGGAINMTDEHVTILDCVFENNVTYGGGAIAVTGTGSHSGKLIVHNSVFRGNKATLNLTDADGGAIVVGNGTTGGVLNTVVEIYDSVFENNEASDRGGALYFGSAGVLIERTTISGNKTVKTSGTSYGGGIAVAGRTAAENFIIRNSTIAGNSAGGTGVAGPGAGIAFIGSGNWLIQNSTITGNAATANFTTTTQGGGIRIVAVAATVGNLTLDSTIISGNTSGSTLTPNDISNASTTVAIYARNSAIGTLAGTINNLFDLGNNLIGANLNLQPLADNGGTVVADGSKIKTVALGTNSAAINTGSNSTGLTVDARGTGFPRTIDGRIDIGAYEAPLASDSLPDSVIGALPDVTTAGGAKYTVSVDYIDATGIDGSTIATGNLTVTGGGLVAQPLTLVSSTPNGTGFTAVYEFVAPVNSLAGFDDSDNGVYTLTLKSTGGVSDIDLNPVTAADRTIGTFRTKIGRTYTVNVLTGTGAGTLADAITKANVTTGSAPSNGVDTIVFDSSVVKAGSTVDIAVALPVISDSVVIRGYGAPADVVIKSVTSAVRGFDVAGLGVITATFENLTIANGSTTATAAGSGGAAIRSGDDNVVVTNCAITDNTAATNGGAILIQDGGNLTITNSTMSKNRTTAAAAHGAAIFLNRGASVVTIDKSTISGNTAGGRGGVVYFNYGGALTVTDSTLSSNSAALTGGAILWGARSAGTGFLVRNSTISGNVAGLHGGGINFNSSSFGTMVIQNSTITGNTAVSSDVTTAYFGGGGITRLGGGDSVIQLQSTILAANTGTRFDIGSAGSVTADRSLIGVSDTVANITLTNSLNGTKASPLDPMLKALANNGGPTQTHELKAGSPAINAGSNPASLSFDQRGTGYARSAGQTDIGAFEVQAVAPPPTATVKIDSGTGQRSMIQSITVTFSEAVNLGANPFTVTRLGTSTIPTPNGSVVLSVAGSGSTYTITFNDPTFAPLNGSAKSLIDGLYTVVLNASDITSQANGQQLDGNGDATAGDSQTTNFHRLYGDVRGASTIDLNGNGFTDNVDLIAFRNANGSDSTQINYDPALDVNADGFIDNIDLIAFRARLGATP